ncbi:hypothetical protein V8C86DRAFT_849228 [Haematococcus lacustris]
MIPNNGYKRCRVSMHGRSKTGSNNSRTGSSSTMTGSSSSKKPVQMVQCAVLAALNRAVLEEQQLWAQSNSSRWMCHWHTHHEHIMCVLLAATVEPRMVLREAYSMGCSMVWGPGDSQGAVGEPVTADQVDELVLELVGVLGEYYTKRMHFLGDFPYLAAALGDPSPAARQRGASRVLQYLSATGPGLAMEDDPLQLFKLQADLQVCN